MIKQTTLTFLFLIQLLTLSVFGQDYELKRKRIDSIVSTINSSNLKSKKIKCFPDSLKTDKIISISKLEYKNYCKYLIKANSNDKIIKDIEIYLFNDKLIEILVFELGNKRDFWTKTYYNEDGYLGLMASPWDRRVNLDESFKYFDEIINKIKLIEL